MMEDDGAGGGQQERAEGNGVDKETDDNRSTINH